MSVPTSNLEVRSKRSRTESGVDSGEIIPTAKQIFKIQRGFAIRLVLDAVESGWEMHELGSLIHSIIQQLPLNPRKIHKFLLKCEVCHPQVIFKKKKKKNVISKLFEASRVDHYLLHVIADTWETY